MCDWPENHKAPPSLLLMILCCQLIIIIKLIIIIILGELIIHHSGDLPEGDWPAGEVYSHMYVRLHVPGRARSEPEFLNF
jgi:hypothetical protein